MLLTDGKSIFGTQVMLPGYRNSNAGFRDHLSPALRGYHLGAETTTPSAASVCFPLCDAQFRGTGATNRCVSVCSSVSSAADCNTACRREFDLARKNKCILACQARFDPSLAMSITSAAAAESGLLPPGATGAPIPILPIAIGIGVLAVGWMILKRRKAAA